MNKYILIFLCTSLLFSCTKNEGCTDPVANNFDVNASLDDGSCDYNNYNINLHFTQSIESDALVKDSLKYLNHSNINYSVQTLRYIISDIKLHKEDGTSKLIDSVQFVNIADESTKKVTISDVTDLEYTSISFTVGLNDSYNVTNLFLNESFFPSFTWPEMLGGGYHYMQLEGEFQADLANGNPSFYNTHTGPTSGTDFSFNKTFPIELYVINNQTDIYIDMEITNWYKNPEIINYSSDGIMGNSSLQSKLKENGENDVFSVYSSE